MAIQVTILDGYTDEPAGLGVPPYIDVYPRYIAGAFWDSIGKARINYYTIDMFRENPSVFYKSSANSEYTFVIAGVVVPGKYLSGNPITPKEVISIGRALNNTCSILIGPAARFGMGIMGGRPAVPSKEFKSAYCRVVSGDPDSYVKYLLLEGVEKASPWVKRKSYSELRRPAVLGAGIVNQHPNHGYNLMVEIETYRGCSRWVTGGCSFCIEPLYGKPIQRDPRDVVLEMEALHNNGVNGFRLGRQADLLVYGSKELGVKEFPKPNPEFMDNFFMETRMVIGDSVLHIDNINPGTLSNYPELSMRVLVSLIKHHTPGDVAALGVETADEKVVEHNNLNATVKDALKAIEIINRMGSERGWNGLPQLLPGINFVLGLPGETKETYEKNIDFLRRVKEAGFLLRRINIRKVMVLPSTRLWREWKKNILLRHLKYAERFTWIVRHVYDTYFLKKVIPIHTVLKNVFIEKQIDYYSVGRQMGSYPITVYVKGNFKPPCILNVLVQGHKGRSVKGEPITNCLNHVYLA